MSVEGSLVDQPSGDDHNWFDVTYQDFAASTGVTAVNAAGKFLWVRVVLPTATLVPVPGPNPFPMPAGTVNRVLYLN